MHVFVCMYISLYGNSWSNSLKFTDVKPLVVFELWLMVWFHRNDLTSGADDNREKLLDNRSLNILSDDTALKSKDFFWTGKQKNATETSNRKELPLRTPPPPPPHKEQRVNAHFCEQ
ncbi:hypothetical protein JZ751_028344 [Albula glossodonta]|uniref:Uncharacterized protein n=1 Tax=Albula glossodonta TaxID=121402 RepID=A0A8T2NCH1_9TELE|nr:hypothetical protein JZ751_028344 [Albula glossodonta]